MAILGSTGSIGRQTLEVIQASDNLEVCALTARNNWQLLAEQAKQFSPQALALAEAAGVTKLAPLLPPDIRVFAGGGALDQLVRATQPDVLLSGVVGAAGLTPALAGIECGAALALANKEALVIAGAIVMPAAKKAGVDVLPVDSEHSAIFQCLASGKRSEVRKVVITASGGALRDWDDQAAAQAGVEDALNHPTWQMGRKITIDSATLINKAMEVVEAHWLFDLSPDEIEVILHPESIVHSCVEFCDGSVIAQMGPPNMAMPIAYALHYPDRADRRDTPLDLPSLGSLTFRPLPPRCRRAVKLGFEAIRRGGVAGAVVNGANEAAVGAFLDGRIRLGRIVELVEDALDRTPAVDEVTLDALIEADAWAQQQVTAAVA